MGKRVTQAVTKIAVQPATTVARITQYPIEVVILPVNQKTRITQLVLEFAVSNTISPTERALGPVIQVI